ncbi:MAG TPA: desulfoferrodoxin FeS4 iron-binding domain-containing protein [Nitrospirota bacterium]|nr:desulfoferrodoxin FeS4 iron-binding domain-containing protein [Nitrospirota bacterium]
MAEAGKTYKCSICGNVVKVLEAGDGELVCCGEPMKKLD